MWDFPFFSSLGSAGSQIPSPMHQRSSRGGKTQSSPWTPAHCPRCDTPGREHRAGLTPNLKHLGYPGLERLTGSNLQGQTLGDPTKKYPGEKLTAPSPALNVKKSKKIKLHLQAEPFFPLPSDGAGWQFVVYEINRRSAWDWE